LSGWTRRPHREPVGRPLLTTSRSDSARSSCPGSSGSCRRSDVGHVGAARVSIAAGTGRTLFGVTTPWVLQTRHRVGAKPSADRCPANFFRSSHGTSQRTLLTIAIAITITAQRSALRISIVPHHRRRDRRHCDHLVDQQSLVDDGTTGEPSPVGDKEPISTAAVRDEKFRVNAHVVERPGDDGHDGTAVGIPAGNEMFRGRWRPAQPTRRRSLFCGLGPRPHHYPLSATFLPAAAIRARGDLVVRKSPASAARWRIRRPIPAR
jgi:hypothetical protein